MIVLGCIIVLSTLPTSCLQITKLIQATFNNLNKPGPQDIKPQPPPFSKIEDVLDHASPPSEETLDARWTDLLKLSLKLNQRVISESCFSHLSSSRVKRNLLMNTLLKLADSTTEDSRGYINDLIISCLFNDENQASKSTEHCNENNFYDDELEELDLISACFKRAVRDGLISLQSNKKSDQDNKYHPLVSFLLSAWDIAANDLPISQNNPKLDQLLEAFNKTSLNDDHLFKFYLIKAINFLISQNKVEAALALWLEIITADAEGKASFCPNLSSTLLIDALITEKNWAGAKHALDLAEAHTSDQETFSLPALKEYIKLSGTEAPVPRNKLLQELASKESTFLDSFVTICKDKDEILRELLPFLTTYVPNNTYSRLFPRDEKPTADYIEGVVNYLKKIPTERYQCLLAIIIFGRGNIKASDSIATVIMALESDDLKMSTKRVLLSFLLELSTPDKLTIITSKALPDLISDSQQDTNVQDLPRKPPQPLELRHKVISLLSDIFLDAYQGQQAQNLLKQHAQSLNALIKTLDSFRYEVPNEEDTKADEIFDAQQIFCLVKYAIDVANGQIDKKEPLTTLLDQIQPSTIKAPEKFANFLAQADMGEQAVEFLNGNRPVFSRYLTGLLYIHTASRESLRLSADDLVSQFREYLKLQTIAGSYDLKEAMELGAGFAALAIRGGANDLAQNLVKVFDDSVVQARVLLKAALAVADLTAAYDAVQKLEELWLGISKEDKGPLYLDLIKLLAEHLEDKLVENKSTIRDDMCARVVILLTMDGYLNRTANFFESGRTIDARLILNQLEKISYSPNQDFTIYSHDNSSNNKQLPLPQAAANLLKLLIKLDLHEQLEEYLWGTPFNLDTLGPLLIS